MHADSSHLGNAGLITTLREALEKIATRIPGIPVLLEEVIYSGTHTGDFLSPSQVMRLSKEIELIKAVELKRAGFPKRHLDAFHLLIAGLERLCATALHLRKPIAF
ncbi:hypothetical protein D1Y84_05960 [Acidipila sp. EB88]|nr:hypothetical protein D1Y84_05960 [Acidipila sp. EB88]